jgi:hypothetical protein
MSPPHSQVSFHFGSWSFDGLPSFQRAITGVKSHWIENFLIPLAKILELRCLKWACMNHFGYLEHNLWLKKGSGIKLAI